MTTRELAELLGLSPATVLRRHRAGEIPGYRLASNVLRFRESEVEAWLEEHRQGNHHVSHTLTQDPESSNLPTVTPSDSKGDAVVAAKGYQNQLG